MQASKETKDWVIPRSISHPVNWLLWLCLLSADPPNPTCPPFASGRPAAVCLGILLAFIALSLSCSVCIFLVAKTQTLWPSFFMGFLVKHKGFPVRISKYWHLSFWLLKWFGYYERPCRPQKRNHRLSCLGNRKHKATFNVMLLRFLSFCVFTLGSAVSKSTCSAFTLGRPAAACVGIPRELDMLWPSEF